MKKYITLYRDADFGDIYTEDAMEQLYEDRYAHVYDSYLDFILSETDCGNYEEITATLSDRHHIYSMYWVEEDIGIQTIMEQYINWQSLPYADRVNNIPTFADFLDIPSTDRNGVMAYGFDFE